MGQDGLFFYDGFLSLLGPGKFPGGGHIGGCEPWTYGLLSVADFFGHGNSP
jgi:hypothetical protein